MSNKDTSQYKDSNTKPDVFSVNNQNVIFPSVAKTPSSIKMDLSDISSEKKKVRPVIVRSFHKDVDEIKNKERHSKEAEQLRKQMNEPEKKEVQLPMSKKSVSHDKIKDSGVAKMGVPKKGGSPKEIPKAPAPPYEKSFKTIKEVISKELPKKTQIQKPISVPQKKEEEKPVSLPKKPEQPISVSKKQEAILNTVKSVKKLEIKPPAQDKKKPLLDIPVPKKSVIKTETKIADKFIDKKDGRVSEKEIIFPRPMSLGGVSESKIKKPVLPKKVDTRSQVGVVESKKSTQDKSDKKDVEMKPFPVKTADLVFKSKPQKKEVEKDSSIQENVVQNSKKVEKLPEVQKEQKPQKAHDIFDAMISGDHTKTLAEYDKKELVERDVELKKQEPKPVVESKPDLPAKKEVELPIEYKMSDVVEKEEEVVEAVKPVAVQGVAQLERQPLQEINISEEELNALKSDLVRIDSEIKSFEAQKESVTARKEKVGGEKTTCEAEMKITKGHLFEKQRREDEITERVHQIEQKETLAGSGEQRRVLEEQRWKQEDMRATVALEKLEVEELYEKNNTLILEKEKELERAEESLKELERQIKERTMERQEKRLKVRLGEIQSKKREIEDIQVALLEEKRRLDRLHKELETEKENCGKERKLAEENKALATDITDKRLFEEKIISTQKSQRQAEQKRWKVEKSLEAVMEKIAKSNEHYKTISKLDEEVRKGV